MDLNKSKDIISKGIANIWELLTPEQQDFLYDQTMLVYYKRNEQIYIEGEAPVNMFCVLQGKAKVYKTGTNNRSQIMRFVSPMGYFGYRAYFAREKYVTSASASDDSLICLIPMNCIEKIANKNIKLTLFFIEKLSKDLGISDKRIITLTQNHIRGRLAETLLFLKNSYGISDRDNCINIELSREDLASLANMTTANAIRTLMAFSTEKLIRTNGRKIKIIDEQTLKKISLIG